MSSQPPTPNLQTPSGNPSTKRTSGRTWKRHLRLERIARLELTGLYTEDQIAISQGITKQYVNMLKRSPEYIAIRMQVASGVVAQADREMITDIEANRDAIRDMLPESLQAIRDILLDRNQPALRLKAAQDVLDRDGTFAKVSKSEVKVKNQYDFSQHDEVAGDLLAALKHNTAATSYNEDALGFNEFAKPPADLKKHENELEESLEMIRNVVITAGPKLVQ